MTRTGRVLRLQRPRSEQSAGRYRVSADVDGQPVWFESTVPLSPAPEAFAGLFWIPALHARRPMEVDALLDPQWLANSQATLPLLHDWWDYSLQSPLSDHHFSPPSIYDANDTSSSLDQPRQASPAEVLAANVSIPQRTGLCFSGGVDSFYSLLKGSHPIDTLVFGHGFDIPLDDRPRMECMDKSLQAVAQATATELVIVRTNLRTHHFFRQLNWERTHGAALAALGHVLSGTIDRLVIASSYQYRDEHPWGSNWRLDPLWSSSRLAVVHDDATFGRQGKAGRIADQPLVQQHLQVCWSRRSVAGNCGSCEKCIRTMVTFESLRQLRNFTVFPRAASLSDLIDAMDSLAPHLHPIWARLQKKIPAGPVADAASRLLHRSDPAVSRWTRWWRRHSQRYQA